MENNNTIVNTGNYTVTLRPTGAGQYDVEVYDKLTCLSQTLEWIDGADDFAYEVASIHSEETCPYYDDTFDYALTCVISKYL